MFINGMKRRRKKGKTLPFTQFSQLKGSSAVSKKVFLAPRASVWYNNKAEARVPRAPPLDPPLIIIH